MCVLQTPVSQILGVGAPEWQDHQQPHKSAGAGNTERETPSTALWGEGQEVENP